MADYNKRDESCLPKPHTLESLVAGAVKNARPRNGLPSPRWAAVADTFGIGSTSARQLCSCFGLDPDKTVGSDGGPENQVDSVMGLISSVLYGDNKKWKTEKNFAGDAINWILGN